MTLTLLLLLILFMGAVLVPLLVIEVNRRREINSDFDRSYFIYSLISLGIQVIFLALFLTDTLQLLEVWGHVIWWLAIVAGLFICVYGIWKRTKNRKNLILFLLTGGISVILSFLYLLGLLITSM